jgi:hypothetical protein
MNKRVVLWSLSILLSVFLGSCSDSPSEPDSGSVDLQLVLSDASVSPSDQLGMTLVVTNRQREAVRLELWGCLANFQIYRGSELVWDLAPLVLCPQGTTSTVIQPGESRRYSATWNVHDTPGTYEARAQLLTNERMSSPAASFKVEG